MKRRRVRFTKTAQTHVDRERAWWLENRDRPDLFASELAEAIRLLELLPGIGAAYVDVAAGLRLVHLGGERLGQAVG